MTNKDNKILIPLYIIAGLLVLVVLFFGFIMFYGMFLAPVGSQQQSTPLSPLKSLVTGFVTAQTSLTVNNVASTGSSVLIQDNLGNSATLVPTTTTPVTYRCSATVTDNNGCANITQVSAYLYRSNVSKASTYGAAGFQNIISNVSNAYENATCVVESNTGSNICTGNSDDTSAVYNCSFSGIPSYLDGTAASTLFPSDSWTCTVVPTDGTGTNGTVVNGTAEVAQNVVMSVLNTSIGFGAVALGSNYSRELWVSNYGNVGFDINVDQYGQSNGDGIAFKCSNWANLSYSTFMYSVNSFTLNGVGGNQTAFSDTATTVTGFNLNKYFGTTASTQATNKTLYLGLAIPSTGIGGTCLGTMTIASLVDLTAD